MSTDLIESLRELYKDMVNLNLELDVTLAETKVSTEMSVGNERFLEWANTESVDIANRIKLMNHRRRQGLPGEDYTKEELLEFSRELWEKKNDSI